jgi:carbon monoxide dehydrogenase subunit G
MRFQEQTRLPFRLALKDHAAPNGSTLKGAGARPPRLRAGRAAMLLEIEKRAEIAVTPENAWALLHDFPELATCIPNVTDLEEVEPDRRYSATISDKIGPFRVTVPVQIAIETIEPPRRIVAAISGNDAKGQARLKGNLEATVDQEGDGTRLVVSTRMDVLGKLATLGAAPMRRRADQIFDEFIARVSARLAEPVAR